MCDRWYRRRICHMRDKGFPIDLVTSCHSVIAHGMEKALRTSGEVLFRHLGNAFGKHNSETPESVATVS
jgi:hypothetical protein